MLKVSLNIAKAKSTEKHNDRKMYKNGSPSSYEKQEHSTNTHWDYYHCGSSFEAEKNFYKDFFTDTLEKTNQKYIKNRHPENISDMDEFHEKHMPHELIIQIGNKDDQPSEDDCIKFLNEAFRKTAKLFKSSNIYPISADIHLDEATPHLHLRFAGITKDGKPSLNKALKEAGVPTPLEVACKKLKISPIPTKSEDILKIPELIEECPELFYQGAPGTKLEGKPLFRSKANTSLNYFTNQLLRPIIEDTAISLGHKIDTIRLKRDVVYENVHDWGAAQDRKKEYNYLSKELDNKFTELNNKEKQLDQKEFDINRYSSSLDQKESNLLAKEYELDNKEEKLKKIENTIQNLLNSDKFTHEAFYFHEAGVKFITMISKMYNLDEYELYDKFIGFYENCSQKDFKQGFPDFMRSFFPEELVNDLEEQHILPNQIKSSNDFDMEL